MTYHQIETVWLYGWPIAGVLIFLVLILTRRTDDHAGEVFGAVALAALLGAVWPLVLVAIALQAFVSGVAKLSNAAADWRESRR
jgi:hypothetical protein